MQTYRCFALLPKVKEATKENPILNPLVGTCVKKKRRDINSSTPRLLTLFSNHNCGFFLLRFQKHSSAFPALPIKCSLDHENARSDFNGDELMVNFIITFLNIYSFITPPTFSMRPFQVGVMKLLVLRPICTVLFCRIQPPYHTLTTLCRPRLS